MQQSRSNAVLLIVNVRLLATVTAVLFDASVTVGEVAVSIVAGSDVWVVIVVVYPPVVALLVRPENSK